jgi:NADH-quinone oxidoreductase subunit C
VKGIGRPASILQPVDVVNILLKSVMFSEGLGDVTCDKYGDAVVNLSNKENLLSVMSFLKEANALQFNMLLSVTAIDWLDKKEYRFDVVYHLFSTITGARIRIIVPVLEDNPTISSVYQLWKSANFLERETWDMYGIKFDFHPRLDRVLLYEEFEGHPLRKDYPLHGKQPRIPLRSPETRNTSMDMKRVNLAEDKLVKIRKK